MHGFRFAVAASAFVVAVSLVIHAEGTTQSQSVEIQLQLGNLFFGEGRYQESLEAYRNAVKVAPPEQMRQARGGVILSSLRVAEFERAREEAERLIQESPRAPESLALYGDALWASGLFEEAENKYKDALQATTDLARA